MDISRDANKTCSFCGHRTATAQWGHDVFCCPHCAIEILPKFMADARHFLINGDPEQDWRDAEGKFWRAIASCRGRDLRKAQRTVADLQAATAPDLDWEAGAATTVEGR